MAIHRIVVDFDIEAESHEDALDAVIDWASWKKTPPGTMDYYIEEDTSEHCPECNSKK